MAELRKYGNITTMGQGSGGGGTPQGILVGVVKKGDSSFPTKRPDGSPLENEDYVRPDSSSEFPFTIGDITFNSSRDKAYYVSGKWYLEVGVIQDTDETPLAKPNEESFETVRANQYQVNKDVVEQLKNAIIEYTDLDTVPTEKLYKRIYRQTQNTTARESGLYWYDFDNSVWVKIGDEALFIHAESHTDIDGYAIPVLTDEQIEKAYNGIIAGKNVFVVDDLDFITIQVLDASSIEGYPTIRLLFTDVMILTYHIGGEIVSKGIYTPENAYDSIEFVSDYHAYADYSRLDYGYAKRYLGDMEIHNFACSSAVMNGHIVRNYDWKYSEDCEFTVRTPNTIGTVGQVKGLTKDFVRSMKYSDKYKLVPFMLVDGMNDAGLEIEINVVPNDHGDTTDTNVGKEKINALMLIRWALDHCSTVADVVKALSEDISIFVPQALRDMGYEVHFLMHDKTMGENDGAVLEFIDNECVWTNHNKMTNFFISGTTFKDDGTVPVIGETDIEYYGLTEHSQGLERYNIIVNHSGTKKELLEKLKYTQLYTLNSNKWYSELCSGDLKITSPMSDFETAMTSARNEYASRTRDGKTDHTVHSAIYGSDILTIYTQENYSNAHTFKVPKQSGDKTYTHIQVSASDTWEIIHNMGKNPSVVCVDSANTMFDPFIEYVNENKIILHFNSAFSGKAYLN